MKRAFLLCLIGAMALLIFFVLRAPARLLDRLIDDDAPVHLSGSAGTIWNGKANVTADGLDLGRVSWTFDAASLMDGAIGLRWSLTAATHSLAGTAQASLAETHFVLAGHIDATLVNRLLSDYHIHLGGTFELDDVTLAFADGPHPSGANGSATWTGGPTRYRLGGETAEVTLPPMHAVLFLHEDGFPQAEAFTGSVRAPLIRTRLDADGWLHIAISRRFTMLAGRPWPGTGGTDEMVVEVAERLRPTPRN